MLVESYLGKLKIWQFHCFVWTSVQCKNKIVIVIFLHFWIITAAQLGISFNLEIQLAVIDSRSCKFLQDFSSPSGSIPRAQFCSIDPATTPRQFLTKFMLPLWNKINIKSLVLLLAFFMLVTLMLLLISHESEVSIIRQLGPPCFKCLW